MRYLFISYNFPGRLGDMAAWLARDASNRVIFASSRQMHDAAIPGVQRAILKKPDLKKQENPKKYMELWLDAIKTGLCASSTFEAIIKSGFMPDIIMASSVNGSIFGLPQIFRQSFIVNFMEDICSIDSHDREMRAIIQHVQMDQAGLTFGFSKKELERLPDYLQAKTALAPLAVDTAFFSPAAAEPFACWKFQEAAKDIITVNLNNIPGARLQNCWHGIQEIAAACAQSNVVILAGNSFIKKLLSQHTAELPAQLKERIFIEENMRREIRRNLLAASELCIFPEMNREISVPLLESMSCGTPVICALAGNAFLQGNRDYIPIKNLTGTDIAGIAADTAKLAEIGRNARKAVCCHYNMAALYPDFFAGIITRYKSWKK